ncbi:hypothetical protein THII_1081 [Thioploca ingrica]|uniref:Type I restriction enzyme R protein N-terminal domain-containing protein n=1 Tax=Thioploca ingrica TaxID=40754 RepID=A0A090ACD9_9GAMM|nr:hypothetical protein THII_1081 [Thioploca ingrica]
MPFSSYKSLGNVLKKFQLCYQEEDYIVSAEVTPSEYLQTELEFVLVELVTNNSEAAVCENLIYPILKESWKPHRDKLMLWSHEPLQYDEDLSGTPDYMITKKSPLGKIVCDQPYLLVVEAKKDNFQEGWGQCLVELIAAQKLSQPAELTVFGVVSNGDKWEFGKLTANQFTKNRTSYTLQALTTLCGALENVLVHCELQLK